MKQHLEQMVKVLITTHLDHNPEHQTAKIYKYIKIHRSETTKD